MPYCYGVCNHSPEQVFVHLRQNANAKLKQVFFVPANIRLKATVEQKYLFFSSLSDYLGSRAFLNLPENKKKTIVVFTSAIGLIENPSLHRLDSILTDDSIIELEPIGDLLPLKAKLTDKIEKPVLMFTEYAIDEVQQGSLLTDLMTAIYEVSGANGQKLVTSAACLWLYSDSDDDIDDVLAGTGVKIKKTTLETIMMILEGPIAENIREVFKEFRALSEPSLDLLEPICKKHKAQKFEVSYIYSKIQNDLDQKRTVDQAISKT